MRVVIAEDSVLLRVGIQRLLDDEGIEVIAAVDDADKLLDAVARLDPDIAIVDIRMPPTHTDEGLRAAVRIRKSFPRTAVVVLSQYVEERYARELLEGDSSAIGYLLKHRVGDVDEFIDAIHRVGAGGTVLDPEVVAQLLGRRQSDRLARLSTREREVLALMAEGRSNAAIASRLLVTERTVEKHITAILTKLQIPDTSGDHRRVLAVLAHLSA